MYPSRTAAASNFTIFVGTGEDFREKIAIQRCFLAFSAHTFFARMLLQQAKGYTPHGRKVCPCVPMVHTALVFPKVHIQLPMEVILDPPMPTQCFSILPSAHPPAADEITHLRGSFPVNRHLAANH